MAPPVGDPGEMRTRVARWGSECAGLVAAAGHVDRRASAMVYHCPAGDRFRTRVTAHRRELERILADVRDLQRETLREAARVEAAEQLWGRLVRLVEGDAAGASNDVATLEQELRRLVQQG